MLHPVLVRLADVVDLNPVRRGGGDCLHHALHLGVCRMKIADIVPQDALRSRHIWTVLAAGVEIKFLIERIWDLANRKLAISG